MRLLRAFALLALALIGQHSFAASGNVTLVGGNTVTFATASNSCADVRSAVMAGDAAVADARCSADPVVVGTNVETYAYGTWYNNNVSAITATAATATPPDGGSSSPSSGATTADMERLFEMFNALAVCCLFALGYSGGYQQ